MAVMEGNRGANESIPVHGRRGNFNSRPLRHELATVGVADGRQRAVIVRLLLMAMRRCPHIEMLRYWQRRQYSDDDYNGPEVDI